MIEFRNVSKTYKTGTHALYNVNLEIEDGEFAYIVGKTGAGKSTLIKLLDGEEVATSGNVFVSGKDIGRIKKSKVYLYRRSIGVVFQDYRLLPEKTVFENVAYALETLDKTKEYIRKRVREVLRIVDLTDKANAKPYELSGGQQQRVAIARAIAKHPMILIADEPTGNLDRDTTENIIKMFERINREEKTTVLLVTHDDVMVKEHPKRTITLQDGHIVYDSLENPNANLEEEMSKVITGNSEVNNEVNTKEDIKPQEEVKQEIKPQEEIVEKNNEEVIS